MPAIFLIFTTLCANMLSWILLTISVEKESLKAVTMTFPTAENDLAFFEEVLKGEIQCFNCSFISVLMDPRFTLVIKIFRIVPWLFQPSSYFTEMFYRAKSTTHLCSDEFTFPVSNNKLLYKILRLKQFSEVVAISYLLHSSLISNFSYRIFYKRPTEWDMYNTSNLPDRHRDIC